MGMYDYIVCNYPLPTTPPEFVKGNDHQYQTKSLDRRMDLYQIRDDGSLWVEEYDIEDHSERAKWKAEHPGEELPKELADDWLSGLAGCMSRVNKRWVQQRFDGVIEFYDGNCATGYLGMSFTSKGEDYEWVTYEAIFADGVLLRIVESERKREIALSRADLEEIEGMFDKDEPEVNTDEPVVGARLYLQWGGGIKGRSVTLAARTSREYVVANDDGTTSKLYNGDMGRLLFHSQEESDRMKAWSVAAFQGKMSTAKEWLARKIATKNAK